MAMTEVEKPSRSILERTFYAKLGPTPAFPPSPAETGQVSGATADASAGFSGPARGANTPSMFAAGDRADLVVTSIEVRV
jgi:hypothetical protein